jgi:protein-S-isoprenylcysteine O-methyltransferase Ste14
MVGRILVLSYGAAAYALFLATFVYACGFVGNLGTPTALDGEPRGPLAMAVDLGLLALFALQHSGMARPRFKRLWLRVVPAPLERATYVMLSSVALLLLFWQWRPLGGIVWDVTGPAARVAVHALFAAGWLTVLATTFLINHFDLFGLRQAWLYFRGAPYTPLPFTTPGPYRLVRHPLYVGWLIAFWAAPTMTAAHLLFATTTTVYILAALGMEERDLLAALPEYADYRRRVPMLVPGLRAFRRRGAEAGRATAPDFRRRGAGRTEHSASASSRRSVNGGPT